MTKTKEMGKKAESAKDTLWKATVLTIFPEMFPGPLGHSLAGRALSEKKWELETVNIRDFTEDVHRTVDDTPFGGGPGMVMKPDVLDKALKSSCNGPVYYLSPRGKPLNQEKAREIAEKKNITLLCGRFEGVDQRLLDAWEIEEISIGDYILSGGELAAMVLMDTVVRLLPGVIGKKESLEEESFEQNLLEHPHYTRPRVWNGMEVPEILVSGDHKRIAAWQLAKAEEITKVKRPDLWQKYINAGNSKKEG